MSSGGRSELPQKKRVYRSIYTNVNFLFLRHVPMQNFTRIPKLNAALYIVKIDCISNDPTSSSLDSFGNNSTVNSSEIHLGLENHQNRSRGLPKWKILRWGLRRVENPKYSIEFDLKVDDKKIDPFSTEYA